MCKRMLALILFNVVFVGSVAQADNPIKIKIPTFVPERPVIILYKEFLKENRFCRVSGGGMKRLASHSGGIPANGKARIFGRKMAVVRQSSSGYATIDNNDNGRRRSISDSGFASIDNSSRYNLGRPSLND
ncbi:MAG: hypothetical protein IT292_03405 [Deltaproteobacteria bacterium]|nr:hypothetical protein [Deltaproteobacteria bacterium]